ncbi:hypothetical protein HanIR_Chr15g0742551 [Helianthus annuus]|nr:hypothetical protein HanIR_Chr15g0742551 [Helianthus annuus]
MKSFGVKSIKSKLPFWSLRFGHFSPKLKPFKSRSIWFYFYCHFGPKMKSANIWLIKSCYFVLFHRGKMAKYQLISLI